MAEANGPLRAILNILTNGILDVAKLRNVRLGASIYSSYVQFGDHSFL